MGTAINHLVPDWVKSSFVIFDIRADGGHSDAQGWASECPDIKNYKWLLNPVWHRMIYSCTYTATGGVKGLMVMLTFWSFTKNILRPRHMVNAVMGPPTTVMSLCVSVCV